VNKATQAITFGALADKTFGDAPFTVSATSSSQLPVSFGVGATDQCRIVGSDVTITGAGTCTVTASQAGNGNYFPATSVSRTFSIRKATPTISWATPAAITYGTALGAAQLNATSAVAGRLTYTPAADAVLGVGTHTLSVTLTPDNTADYDNGSATVSLAVVKAPTVTTITAHAPNPSVPGQAVTIAVSVAAASGTQTPTGTVHVTSAAAGDQRECVVTLNAGAGSCTVTPLTVGQKTIQASYDGNANFNGGISPSTTHQVGPAAGTVTLDAASLSQTFDGNGKSVSVTTNPPNLSVNVAYSQGSTAVTAPTNAGSYHVVATITDPGYQGSAEGTLVIGKAPTTVAITTHTPDPSFYGDAIQVQFAVSRPAGTVASPTGSVTVSDGTSSCTGAVAAGACALVTSSPGNKTLIATYSGDGNFTGNSSSGTAHVVNKAPTRTTITSASPAPSVAGQAVTVAVRVTPVTAVGTPTGTAAVSIIGDLDRASCVATLANGVGSCVLTPPGIGAYTILASYGGDALFAENTSPSFAHQVNKATATLTLSGLEQTYDGLPKAVTVSTTPPGLTGISVTYAGSPTPPTAAGSYAVVATLNNPTMSGSASGTLVIAQRAATVRMASASRQYGDANPPFGASFENLAGEDVLSCQYSTSATITSPVGSYATTATCVPDANYKVTVVEGTFRVDAAPLTATADNASRPYGTNNPTFTGRLTGVKNSDGITASYVSSTTAATNAGVYDNDITPVLADPTSKLANYRVTLVKGQLTITKVTPVITWNTPASITFGTPLSATQLNATTTVPGTFTYNPAVGAVLNAGTQTLTVSFVPADPTNYNGTGKSVNLLVVGKATPTISWNPADLTNPTGFGAAQKNATAYGTDGRALVGTYSYSLNGTVLADGAVLAPGLNQPLTVTFTPTGADADTYNSATKTVTTFNVLNKIDITPNVSANYIYLGSGATEITVAILGTGTSFDARTVAASTPTLGNGTDLGAPLNTNADGSPKTVLIDINGDGKTDLLCYFKKADVIKYGKVTTSTTKLVLLADLNNGGRKIKGVDNVIVMP
jgi:hypothetical protein